VIEGAAGAGKTTTLAAARELLEMQDRRLMVVTPTLKAAQVAQEQIGAAAFTGAWLVHQHGFRWDADGHWSRNPVPRSALPAQARLLPGDLLLVDEAGMLDQDVARALLTIADESKARIAFVGDRHQLPAVGRGGVLDHAARWARPEACLELETVHRFTDPQYAALTLLMRTGQSAGDVFDRLHERGLIQIHPTRSNASPLSPTSTERSSPTPASRSPHSTPRCATGASPPARPILPEPSPPQPASNLASATELRPDVTTATSAWPTATGGR
jgi:hypothetical protein